jgi:hypothetical protein
LIATAKHGTIQKASDRQARQFRVCYAEWFT